MKSPFNNTDIQWEPALSYFLAGLDVCDCADGVRDKLRAYNPNCSQARLEIIEKFILPDLDYLSHRHRFAIISLLELALADSNFDFSIQFAADYDEYSETPWSETEIEDPRGFFEEIYRLAAVKWKDDLQKASSEDQSTW
jgi:hypothetical protein